MSKSQMLQFLSLNISQKNVVDAVTLNGSKADKSTKMLNILVADDDFIMREGNKMAITKALKDKVEFKVTTVESGEQAFDILQKEKVDFLFSDVNMKDYGLDGWDLTQKIRQNNIDVKVFIVSCLLREEGERQAKQAGADGFIEAPLNDNKVIQFMGSYING